MIIAKLLTALKPQSLTLRYQQPIIASLFKKKYQAETPKPPPPPQTPESKEEKQKQKKEPEDHEYDFFERRKEVDTSFDFTKLRDMNSDNIPEELGRGGIEEVLYWSQCAVTPDQITHVLTAFNKTAKIHPEQLQNIGSHKIYLDDFNIRVTGNIYLLNSLELLRDYALFAYNFKVNSPQFWEKLEFKTVKFFPKSVEEASFLVDIGFIMGQFQAGTQIYNHVSKMLQDMQLSIDQYAKLFITFHMLKAGEKPWISKLLTGLSNHMQEADAQQLAGVLSALKELKKLPESMNINIEKRVLQLIEILNLEQLMNIVEYFGFQHESKEIWSVLQERAERLLKDVSISGSLLTDLILKVMPTYKFSQNFILRHIVGPIQNSKLQVLDELQLTTVSTLSKGLYIYELQNQTKHIQIELSKLVIGKMTKYINELADSEIVKVIQDYNLSRNGSRELYIFLEEVVKIRYLKGYNPELDRHTIELLIEIYGNSGMCTREMFEGLQALINDV